MADPLASNTVLYLRPQSEQAIVVLDSKINKPYVETVAPPPEPTDIRLDGIPDPTPSTHLSPHDINGQDCRSFSRESTPGPYAIHPRVLRLGFDSNQNQRTRGFVFGSGPDSDVKLPYYGKKKIDKGYYFRIHYNFNSGALLITAMELVRIGSTLLKRNESLLLIADTVIESGGEAFRFVVEFPDLCQCANEHERNYRTYVEQLGVPNAPYMATSRDEDPPIGCVHKSKALLGKGSFGEVHKAVNIKTGELCAIKRLSQGGENKTTGDQLHEAKLLSRLSHPNIIEYHDTFVFKGQICIVMELAVNDLLKHQNARKSSKRTPFLPLRCIQSIARQSLAAIEYLHAEGVTHRDLKPENILVTKWEPKTDLPTIKLTDFGLASLKSEHATFCGTKGWLAPEVERAMARLEELRKQQGVGMKTITRPFSYNNSVDIWALGKILGNLLHDVPSSRCIRGKNVSASKEPATRLINRMMQEVPGDRPTASECLEDPWIVPDDSPSSFQTTKRERSPTPTSSAVQPLKRVLRTMLGSSISAHEGSTEILMSLLWTDEHSKSISCSFNNNGGPSVVASLSKSENAKSSVGQGHTSSHLSEIDYLTIKPGVEGQLSLIAHCRDGSLIHGSLMTRDNPDVAPSVLPDLFTPQGTSSSMQAVAKRLLAALKTELYGNDEEAMRKDFDRLALTSLRIRQYPESSILLGTENDDVKLTGSFWNPSDPDAYGADNPDIRVAIDRLLTGSLQDEASARCNHPSAYQLNSALQPHQRPIPAIRLDDGQILYKTTQSNAEIDLYGEPSWKESTFDMTQSDSTSMKSNCGSSIAAAKGVTYPSQYDDVMAGMSY